MKNRKLAIGLAASLTFAMAGCTTVNPYTQEQQTSKAAIGAGVGAVTGAIVGATAASTGGTMFFFYIGLFLKEIALTVADILFDMYQSKWKLKIKILLVPIGMWIQRKNDS